MNNTADVIDGKLIEEREVLFFYFVSDTTRDLSTNFEVALHKRIISFRNLSYVLLTLSATRKSP
jgi:hypothetical protein